MFLVNLVSRTKDPIFSPDCYNFVMLMSLEVWAEVNPNLSRPTILPLPKEEKGKNIKIFVFLHFALIYFGSLVR